MNVTVRIGMEAHLQLRTKSKMFCRCRVHFGAPPNEVTCPVCLGMPGALPVPNRDAMILALALATSLGCELSEKTRFDRKSYFYPDLPKGYQISQYRRPLGRGGALEIVTDRAVKRIRLRRLHIEEDTGRSVHDETSDLSRLDFNRAGTPLVEIVSEPDLVSPEEARAYLQALRTLVRYLDISDGNMEEGNLRCEPNVNLLIEDRGRVVTTPVVEIKNLNSVRNVERALRAEITSQVEEYREKGAAIEREPRRTCGFDEAEDRTYVMRLKEAEHDYRYFPEPDIPPIAIGKVWRDEATARVPELPGVRRRRFCSAYGLGAYDADLLCRDPDTAAYFEQVVAAGAPAKPVVNWIAGELARHANERKTTPAKLGLPPTRLAELVALVDQGRVARQTASKQVLPIMLEDGSSASRIVESLGLDRVDDAEVLRAAARRAVRENPRAAEDFLAGRSKALGALMGDVMRETEGKANPQLVRDVLREILESR